MYALFTGTNAVSRELQAIHPSAVVIITRPPEIIACMKLIINMKDVFVIFDSHARPSHPDGAGFILNTSIHRTAARLSEILPVDSSLLSDGDLQWQAQLLANYSGHIFVSRGLDNGPEYLMQTVVESSLEILALRAEVSEVKSQNSMLTSENKRLEEEMEQMEEEHREERKRILQSSKVHEPNSYRSASASTQISHPVMGSRVALYQSYGPPADPHRIDEDSWSSVSSSSSNSHQRHPLKQEGTGPEDSHALVEQMQLDWL